MCEGCWLRPAPFLLWDFSQKCHGPNAKLMKLAIGASIFLPIV